MNKSKFLKKSLAMLLAVMLVVAMIPLSASAAPEGLSLIYVDGNVLTLGSSMEVDVNENDFTDVEIRTNEDWEARGYELRVQTNDSQWTEKVVDTDGYDFEFTKYLQSNGTIILNEYAKENTQVEKWTKTNSYVLTVNKVKAATTTNLQQKFTNVAGVYSVNVDNDEKIVNVVLARDTRNNETDKENPNSALNARATLYTEDHAKFVDGAESAESKTVELNDGEQFTVTSESGKNKATFKVKATYLDALATMTVIGLDNKEYTAEAVDTNYDDIPDSFTVTMPDSAIYDEHNELKADPKLGIAYDAQGDTGVVNTAPNSEPNVVVNLKDSTDKVGIKADGSVPVELTGLHEGTQQVVLDVTTTRLPADNTGATQTYTLTVQLERDNNTDITYARVNSTIADWDLDDNTITADLPKVDADNGKVKKATVVLRTAATVQEVQIGTKKLDQGTPGDGYTEWTFNSIDLTKDKIVTVKAEDGTDRQYTLSASVVTNTTDAVINALWIGDYQAKVDQDEDDIYVTVPYMTLDVEELPVYVTPASYTYVTYGDKDAQIINGTTTAKQIGLKGTIKVGGELTAEIVARNKNVKELREVYTIHVVLEDEVATGNTLTDLEFTAQPTSNNTDKAVIRAMTEANTINTEVEKATSGANSVKTLNIKVPVSLYDTDDLGVKYRNIVTDFATRDDGVAFAVDKWTGEKGTWTLSKLTKTTEEKDVPITGDVVATDWAEGVVDRIVVLPEETARAVLAGGYRNLTGSAIAGEITYDKLINSGTSYKVVIEPDTASSEHELKTMSLGDFDFTIEGNKIKGNMPFSLTTEDKDVDNAVFVEFTVSDYARLINKDSSADGKAAVFFSNGDWDGDGEVDEIDEPSGVGVEYPRTNYKMLFVRNTTDHTVDVYRVNKDNVAGQPMEYLTVLAEDRLADGGSSGDYVFELTWEAPCEEADIKTFELDGHTGAINNDPEKGRTIEVSVPYGTDVTGMTAEFTTSTQAVVTVGSQGGMVFESGVTSLNYTNPVTLVVTSEDGDTVRYYTVTVTKGYTFEDIDEDDWFYDDVVAAAEEGYINGMEPGKYEPLGKLTRAQFATMIARAMNYDSNPDVEASFPDVKDDHYAKAAINFCYENDIIRGYEDGTFKPDKTISRQEVAAILARAFNLEEISSKAYPDDSQIAGWASDDVYKCLAAELMMGDADTGNFRPVSDLTRAEAATILMNANRAGFID